MNRKEMQADSDDQVVFTVDLAGNIRGANKAAEALTGYSTAELMRLSVLDLLPGKCAADLRRIVRGSIRQRFGTVFEIEITTRDRRQIVVEVSIDLVRCADRRLEFRGIAVVKNDAANSRRRPRCLDSRFQFRVSRQENTELRMAW